MFDGLATFPQDHQLLVGWALIVVVLLLVIWLCVITGVFAKKEHFHGYHIMGPFKRLPRSHRSYRELMPQNSSIIDPLFATG